MPHVTFIHGIANKPAADKLRRYWLNALAEDRLGNGDGLDLSTAGVSSAMVYWADVLYDQPLADDAFESAGGYEAMEGIAAQEQQDPSMAWREEISGNEKQVVDALAAKLSFDMLVDDTFTPPESEVDRQLERIPIPWFIKRRLMKQFLRDVHHYLFNYRFSPRAGHTYHVRDEIRTRAVAALTEGAHRAGPHIVVAHSMGTVIAYDCLSRVADCPRVDGLMTIGSPLGFDELQDTFKPEWSREDGFPAKVQGPWVNVYDTLDPVVGFDGNIANDYKQRGTEVIEVINEQNWGKWRHDITNYLSGPKLRAALLRQLAL